MCKQSVVTLFSVAKLDCVDIHMLMIYAKKEDKRGRMMAPRRLKDFKMKRRHGGVQRGGEGRSRGRVK